MQLVEWEGKNGEIVNSTPVNEQHGDLYIKAKKAQKELIERIADLDDEIMEMYLEEKSRIFNHTSHTQRLEKMC
jgi:hypothetical protein